MFNLVLEKAGEPEIKLPTSAGSSKKQGSARKTSISALLTMPKPLTVWITINWKILKEMGILDYLTCLLRNLYAGQEATVRNGHGTMDWFKFEKGEHQQEAFQRHRAKRRCFHFDNFAFHHILHNRFFQRLHKSVTDQQDAAGDANRNRVFLIHQPAR